uniref:odorant receptor 67c-like n=1 Tax=Osmia lignaria TaxID=473952 RepID=UPI001478E770|nr:odorant receptor 67c-like [Osmia lignaria]
MTGKSIISHPVEFSLRLIGAWPNSSYPILKHIVWSATMTTILIFQYWYCITHVKTDSLTDLLDGLSITFSNTLLLLKFIIIWSHRRVFSETLTIMAEDWDNCKSEWNMEVMINKATLSYRITKIMIVSFTFSITLYSISVFFGPDDNDGTLHPNERKFLLRMELPFEATISPIYEIIVTLQIIAQSTFTLMAGMLMTLIATLVLHLASQIEMVCERLTKILNDDNGEESRVPVINNIIMKHQRILDLSDNIDDVFTFISMIQFFFNTVVICFVSFILVTSLDTDEVATTISKCFPYYVIVHLEALILCYTGEYLTTKSKNIGWTAYNSNWYRLSIRECRTLLLLILRSQRPLTLTIGKFINLSLETFANVSKFLAFANILVWRWL